MSPAVVVVIILFVAVYGTVAILAKRRPLIGKLAVREAFRRRGQSALVIAGLMVGTATITAALVGADSVGDSAVDAFAYRNWGHVDITVTSSNRTFSPGLASRLASDPDVARVVDGVAGGVEVVGSASNLDRRLGTSRVVLVGFDPAEQRPFGAYVRIDGRATYGDDLAPGQVLISRVLAEKIDARPGDRLRFSVDSAGATPTGAQELTVAGIARQEGPGAYTLGSVVFAPLPTAQGIAGIDGINIIRVSALGAIRDTSQTAAAAFPVVRRAVARLDATAPLEVSDAKRREADNAEGFTVFIRAMLVGMSILVVAVGAALVVNIIGMLAEERRSRLGVLRALGLIRRRLVSLSVTEGALYSLAAGIVGTAVGIAAGRLVSSRFGQAFAEFAGEDFDFDFFFSLRASTVVIAFAIGSVLTLGVVFFASRRTARMTITAAIRNLPEPPPEKRPPRWYRVAALVVLALAGLTAVVSGEPWLRLIGAIALILIASRLLRSRLSPRVQATLTGLALAGASFGSIAGMDPNADANEFFGVFVVAMLTSVFGLTILAAANLHMAETIVGLLGRAFAPLRAILRPPLAYLSRRPVRTGLTTGVFAVIIGMLTMFAVFFVIFRPDYQRFGNGYDVRVISTGTPRIELPDSIRADVSRAYPFPTRGYVGPVDSEDNFSDAERTFLPLYEVPVNVPDDPPVRLEDRDERYPTDKDAWRAIISDPRNVVATVGTAGTTITLEGANGPVKLRVVAIYTFGLMDGVIGTSQALAPFRNAPLGATMLVDLKDQNGARGVARTIERDLFASGVDAESVQALLDQAERANRAFFSTIDVLMRMGLIIGILSLGIVALRVVTERQHVIGVLRAIGYKRRAVMAGLMTESAVTATIGVVVGMIVGLTMGYLFYRQQDVQPGFGVDWASIGGILGIVYIAVLLVTLGPAWRASRLPPAEAVRYTE